MKKNPPERRRAPSLGFTLIELMVTIAVLAIMASIAAPSLQGVLKNNRLTGQANNIVTAMQYARSEAIRSGRTVTICAGSAETDGSNPNCSGNWGSGWIVADRNPSSGDAVASRVWPAMSNDIQVTAPETEIKYLRDGSVADDDVGAGGTTTIFLQADDCRGDQRREIVITRTGTVSVSRLECA